MAGDEREMNPAIFDVSPRITHFRILEYDNIYSSHEHMPLFHELLYILAGHDRFFHAVHFHFSPILSIPE